MSRVIPAVFLCLLVLPLATRAEPKADAKPLLLDDFETEPKGWTYIDGREFPGGKGSLTLDAADAHGGKRSYKLEADFSGGGANVGVWRDLDTLKGRDVNELRLWVKAVNVTSVGVRLADDTDQIHQTKGVKLAATADWQQVVLKISDLVGGEHWGGANDGKWHGPVKAFGLNVGKDSLAAGESQGSLNIDDVEAVPGPVIDGHPTLLSAVPNPPSCTSRTGFASRLTYRWDAEPMGRDFTVFVHFVGPDGKMAFQNDHVPPTPTSVWTGRVEYDNGILVPIDAPDGDYRIMAGLYDRRAADRGWDHQRLKTGEDVTATDASAGVGQIGVLKVDSQGPLPKLPPPTLNLDGYTKTFDDEFDDLSVSASGPGTRLGSPPPRRISATPVSPSRRTASPSRSRRACCASRRRRRTASGGRASSPRRTPGAAASPRNSAISRCARSSRRAKACGRRSGCWASPRLRIRSGPTSRSTWWNTTAPCPTPSYRRCTCGTRTANTGPRATSSRRRA